MIHWAEKEWNVCKNIEHKTQRNNLFRKKKPNEIQNEFAWNLRSVIVIISLPEKSSSKLALCVITQTLPVFVNFNLMDPSEILKLWIKNIQPQFLTFCLDILIITTKVNNNYNFFYNQWTRMNLCQWKTNLNLSLTLQKPFLVAQFRVHLFCFH